MQKPKIHTESYNSDTEEHFYKAQILMLDVSKAKLQERIDNSRVHVPTILDTSVELSSSDSELTPPSEVVASSKRVAKDKKEKRKEKAAASNQALRKIMQKNLQKKKSSPVCSQSQKPATATSSCSGCDNLKRKLEQQRIQLVKAEEVRDTAQAEADAYQQLNKKLQESILDKFESNKKICFDASISGDEESAGSSSSQSSASSSRSPRVAIKSAERHSFTVQDGKVHVGGDLWIDEKKWDIIEMQKKHSMFVKHFVTSIWGLEGLKGRSVDGMTSKPGLSPKKLKTIKDRFSDRLEEQGYTTSEKAYELAKLKKYITEKVQNANRKEKTPVAKTPVANTN